MHVDAFTSNNMPKMSNDIFMLNIKQAYQLMCNKSLWFTSSGWPFNDFKLALDYKTVQI